LLEFRDHLFFLAIGPVHGQQTDSNFVVHPALFVLPPFHLFYRSRIERGLDWAAKTNPAETDLDVLLKRRARKAPRRRARRA
jgi:hypothetical protein